jgi:uncharacterized protein (TIGR03083 family)
VTYLDKPARYQPQQVNEAVAVESAALTAAASSFTDPQWTAPTCCPPWTVADELAHVVTGLGRTLSMLAGDVPPPGPLVDARGYFVADRRFATDTDDARITGARQTAEQAGPAALVAELDEVWREVVAQVADEPADRRVTTRHGDLMLLTEFQATRVLELAVHGLDLADAVGRPPWLTDAASDLVETLLFGAPVDALREKAGWDRADLLRRVTGRHALDHADQASLTAAGLRPLTLSPS